MAFCRWKCQMRNRHRSSFVNENGDPHGVLSKSLDPSNIESEKTSLPRRGRTCIPVAPDFFERRRRRPRRPGQRNAVRRRARVYVRIRSGVLSVERSKGMPGIRIYPCFYWKIRKVIGCRDGIPSMEDGYCWRILVSARCVKENCRQGCQTSHFLLEYSAFPFDDRWHLGWYKLNDYSIIRQLL